MKRGFWICLVNNFVSLATASSMMGVLALVLSPALTSHGRRVHRPLFGWACFAVAIAFVVAGTLAHIRLRRIEYRETTGLCPACGYDLRASKDRCPECGLAIMSQKRGQS